MSLQNTFSNYGSPDAPNPFSKGWCSVELEVRLSLAITSFFAVMLNTEQETTSCVSNFRNIKSVAVISGEVKMLRYA